MNVTFQPGTPQCETDRTEAFPHWISVFDGASCGHPGRGDPTRRWIDVMYDQKSPVKRRRGTRPRVPAEECINYTNPVRKGKAEKSHDYADPMRRGRGTNSSVGDDAYIVPQQAKPKKKTLCETYLLRFHIGLIFCFRNLRTFPDCRCRFPDRSGPNPHPSPDPPLSTAARLPYRRFRTPPAWSLTGLLHRSRLPG